MIDHSKYYYYIAEDIVDKRKLFEVYDIIYFTFPSNPNREYYGKKDMCNTFLSLIPMQELCNYILENYGIKKNELSLVIDLIKKEFHLKHNIKFNPQTLINEHLLLTL